MQSRRPVGLMIALAVVLTALAAWTLRSAPEAVSPAGQESGRAGKDSSDQKPGTLLGRNGPGRQNAADGSGSGASRSYLASGAGRDLLLRVKYAEGGDAAGLRIVATSPDAGGGAIEGVTDSAGVARIRVPWREGGRVAVRRGGGFEVAAVVIPPVDPKSSGDGETEVLLHPYRQRQLQIWVRLGGAPSLPRPFRLAVDGAPVDLREVDLKRAFISAFYALTPATTLSTLSFEWEGGVPVALALPPDDGMPGVDVHMDLDPAGTPLDVRIVPPRAIDAQPSLERWDAAAGYFKPDRILAPVFHSPRGEISSQRVEGLPVGRYRITVSSLLTTSEPVEVLARASPATIRLDLSRAGWVRGSFDAPPDVEPNAFGVWIWDGIGTATSLVGQGRGSRSDGFQIAVPGDRPLTLQAHHPMLLPDARSGTITVTEPQDGLLLRLERGNTASVRLLRPDDAPFPADARVLVSRIPAAPHMATITGWAAIRDGVVRFGGFAPGIYTLVLDYSEDAPLVIPGLPLGTGETSLGDRQLSAGFSIRLRIRMAPGMTAPKYLTAYAGWSGGIVGGGRDAHRDPATGGLVISGLPPGRHRVRFLGTRDPLPPATGLEQDVDVGPGIDAEVTVNFDPGPLNQPDKTGK